MTEDFQARLSRLDPARRALLEKLQQRTTTRPAAADLPPILRRPAGDRLVLSAIQEQLWFLDQIAPGQPTYNVCTASRLTGPLDRRALQQALDALVARHESLRTVFAAEDGRPYQLVRPPQPTVLHHDDLSGVAGGEIDGRIAQLLHDEVHSLFDLAAGPLFRARLISIAPADNVLAISAHHSVVDGVSLGIIGTELAELYAAQLAGRPADLAPIPVRYSDFAAWQREHYLDSPVMDKHLAYWETQLRGVPALELPSDRPRPPVFSFRGAYARHRMSPQTRKRVQEYARRTDVSSLMQLMAAFQTVLHRYTGAQTLTVGTTVPGRSRRELEPVVGCFTNFVVLRTELAGDPTFGELLGRVRECVLGGWEHQDAPFEQVVKRMNGAHDPSRNPLFSVGLQVLDSGTGGGVLSLPGTTAEGMSLRLDRARFDLATSVVDDGEDFEVVTEYSTDLFDADRIVRLMRHIERVLVAGLAAPDTKLSQLPLLDDDERETVLRFARGVERPFHRYALPDLVAMVAGRSPESVAIVAGEDTVTYGELYRRAEALAARLTSLNVQPGDRVGLALERGIDAVVAILAVNIAGAAYVPLDLGLPVQRLSRILEDSSCVHVLTHSASLDKLQLAHMRVTKDPDNGFGVLCLDEQPPAAMAAPEASAPPVPVDSDAYVIYTSGSTGVPKGVAIQHGMVCAYLDFMVNAQNFDSTARTLHASTLAFDASVAEIFNTLAGGGTLVIASRDDVVTPGRLGALLQRERVTHLFATPGVLRLVSAEDYPDLRGVVIGGEVCPASLAKAWQGGGRRVFNVYGPTETTIACIGFDLSDGDGDTDPPIGRPMTNRRAYLVDENFIPVPVGVPGEILLGGAGVAEGYLNRPELTAEKFVDDPFEPGGRAYRSGDLASWTADGQIRFHGRIDGQVKLRGLRIELGDIEATLERHPAVAGAAVTIHTIKNEPQLVGYVVAADEVSPADLRTHLGKELPAYMIPSVVVTVDELPLSPSGKVDRRLLPTPDIAREEAAYVAPRTTAETLVSNVFAEVLGRERVSADGDFFALGGHSLLAARAVALLSRRSGVQLPTQTFYVTPTVAALAQRLGEVSQETLEASRVAPSTVEPPAVPGRIQPAVKARDCMVPLNPGGKLPPLFCPHAVSGSPFSYGAMARMLGPDQPVYGFEAPGLDGETEPTADMGRLAALYNDELVAMQPDGGICLAGWSMGGFLVFEMARQLVVDHGREVALVAMLDPDPPGPYHDADELEVAQRFAHELASMSGGEEPAIDPGLLSLDETTRLRVVGKALVGAGLMPADVPETFVRNRYAVFRANMLSLYKYQPPPYPGTIVHIGAEESVSTAPGWSEHARDTQTIVVSGGHYSMFAPANLPSLVGALKNCLSAAASVPAK